MREILFRGKRLDNGAWVTGWFISFYSEKSHSNRIYTGYAEEDCGDYFPDWFEVDPATVGQYTGLEDKYGKKIFEGDIVLKRTYNGKRAFPVTFTGGMFHAGYGGGSSTATHGYTLDDQQIEIIGNIHDNPELLEEEICK